MALYTEKQLSTILSAHAAGQLMRFGSYDFRGFKGCINQIAFNEPACSAAAFGRGLQAMDAAGWFDRYYKPDMTPEELLQALEGF